MYLLFKQRWQALLLIWSLLATGLPRAAYADHLPHRLAVGQTARPSQFLLARTRPLQQTETRATIRYALVNLRGGPSTEYPTTAQLNQGANCPINGRSGDNTWWQLDCGNGIGGWVLASLVDVSGNTATAPFSRLLWVENLVLEESRSGW